LPCERSDVTLHAPVQVTGFKRYLPGLAGIVDGARHSAVADSRAALTVWAVVVPQSLAYATLAGVPSVNGLYAAVAAPPRTPCSARAVTSTWGRSRPLR